MRIRATVAAVTGALALSAFALPTAHAADSGTASYREDVTKVRAAAATASGRTAFSAAVGTDDPQPYPLDATFSGVKVNNGKAIVVGPTGHVKVPYVYTLTHGADVDITAADFATGAFVYKSDAEFFGDDPAVCTATSSTVATCKGVIDLYPASDDDFTDLANSAAGALKSGALAIALNGQDVSSPNFDITKVGVAEQEGFGSPNLQRLSKLTVNAAPEPVKKGKTVTVTGKLSRANWDDGQYHGYAGQSVRLQFRKKNSSTYTNVKGIKSSSTGTLKTTTTATVDGYYRFSFVGTSTTPAVNATGDYVDVK
ncbi:hypothetical protein ABT075_40210 [Streptomyces sp. NPDC002677]|uniref:hypothetical protein n=1 Tax=Streptomyces sp. NPDC002677 TaxID=3154774 RepID=UPI00331EA65D